MRSRGSTEPSYSADHRRKTPSPRRGGDAPSRLLADDEPPDLGAFLLHYAGMRFVVVLLLGALALTPCGSGSASPTSTPRPPLSDADNCATAAIRIKTATPDEPALSTARA